MIFFLYVKKYYVLDFNLQFKLRIKTVFYSIGSELLIFSVLVLSYYVSTFWAACFRIKTIFGSPLHPVVCRRAHVVFTLFVFIYV